MTVGASGGPARGAAAPPVRDGAPPDAAAPAGRDGRGGGGGLVLPIPEYCKVVGVIAPVDPTAPNINFQVNMPTAWNRKMAQLGGSGYNGSIPGALTSSMQFGPESLPPNAPYALSRGFVVYGSDSGHQQGGAARGAAAPPATQGRPRDWTTNDEALANFAHAQMKKTHDVTVALIKSLYNQSVRRSYFLGSSAGGREGLIVAQRYPQDYDGVFSQVPAPAMIQVAFYDLLFRAKAQQGEGWIPAAKVVVIGGEVRRQCDALDGLEDGLVSNYPACYKLFDPAITPNPLRAVRCPDGSDSGAECLSDAQIKAAETSVYGRTRYPFALANGWTSAAGYSVGGETPMNWMAFGSRPSASTNLGGLSNRILSNPGENALNFDLAAHEKDLQMLSALLDATNPDLSKFKARGGKLIMKVNTSDYTVNPRWVMEYYDSVVKKMGQSSVDQFVRFYVAVGLSHNRNVGRNPVSNEPVPNYLDFIKLLDDWADGGKAPADNQVLTDMEASPPFAVRATFPLCRYPMYPQYKGGGADPKTAASYRCARS
jgi:feruloyl esterase